MASRNLGTLTIDLIANIAGFVMGMDAAERKSKKFRDEVARNLSMVKSALLGVAATSVATTAALVKSSIDHADALSKQSKIIGIGIKDLSALTYAAELSDVSFEELSSAMRRNARAVEEALEGVGAGADAYQRLQIDVRNADGSLKSNMQLLEEVADRFARLEDGAHKTALAQDLFGRSGAKLIPLLNDGRGGLEAMRREAERLGLVIDQDAGAAAEAFNDALTRVRYGVKGAGNEIMVTLVPHLERFADTISDPETQEGIKKFVGWLANIAELSLKAGVKIGNVTSWIAGLFTDDTSSIEGINAALAETNERIGRLREQISNVHWYENEAGLQAMLEKAYQRRAELLRLREELQKAAPAEVEQAPVRVTPAFELADVPSSSALDGRISKLREMLALHGKDTELSRLQAEIQLGLLSGTREQIVLAEGLARAIDSLAYADRLKEADEAFEKHRANMERQIALYGETSAAAEMLYDIEHGALGQISAEQKNILVNLANQIDLQRHLAEEQRKEMERIEEQGRAIQELGLQAARNMQTNFADFLFDPFDEGLDGMFREFANTLRRMAAEAGSAAIFKSLFGGLGSSTNPILAGIGRVFAGMFDSGGMIPAGQFGIVGELGPEIVRGPAHVTSRLDTARALGAPPKVEIIVNGNGVAQHRVTQRYDAGRNTVQAIVDAINTAGREGMLDDLFAQFGASRSRGPGGR